MAELEKVKRIVELQTELEELDKEGDYRSGITDPKEVHLGIDGILKISEELGKEIIFEKRYRFDNPYRAVIKTEEVKCMALVDDEEAYKLKEDGIWDGEFNE